MSSGPRRRGAARSGRPAWGASAGASSRPSSPTPRFRVEQVVERATDERERKYDEDDADAWRDIPPPGSESRSARLLRRPEDLTPRRCEGVAEPDERERRLGQDRAGEDEDRIRDDEPRHVGQDVDAHHPPWPRADDPRPVDERPLLHRHRL